MNTAVTSDLTGAWRIWFDDNADWQNEPIHLPGTPLDLVTAHMPTGGWSALDDGNTIAVPAVTDDVRADYHGVSWWSRTIELSGTASSLIRFCAVRLRAEIFLDGELIGYDIEGYTPFEVIIPAHLNTQGEHQLAVRVTNPGGSDNWEDLNPIRWSGFTLPSSQDFGGIWQPVFLIEHGGMRITDLWITCDIETRSVIINAETEGLCPANACVTIHDPEGTVVHRQHLFFDEPRNTISHEAKLDAIKLHGLAQPYLYTITLQIEHDDWSDIASKKFGFRELTASNGELTYNGAPVYLATSISWGLYENGPIASAQEIAREVHAIQSMGQNMLTAHRRPANPELIDALDAAGIILYQEPGGLPSLRGRMGCGKWLPADDLASAMTFAKLRIERLWKRDRSRASLVWWNLANECLDIEDPGEPAHELLATARAVDASRMTTWTSGWGPSPAYTPMSVATTSSFDFHTVLNWPSIWHPQLDAEIASVRPSAPMPYISGESQNFTSLSGLGELARAAEQRQPRRRHDDKHIDWHRNLSEDLAEIDPQGRLGSADGFCAATAKVQTDGVARLVRHHRANPDCDGLAINGWHSHPLIGTMGILQVDRHPAVAMPDIAEANAPIQIVVQDMRYDLQAGASIVVQPVVLNNLRLEGLPVRLSFMLGDVPIAPTMLSATDGSRAQMLPQVPVTLPGNMVGNGRLSVTGTIGENKVSDRFDIKVTRECGLDATDIHLFDPRAELIGLLTGEPKKWRMGSGGPTLICANNLRMVQTLFDGPPRRAAVLMRPELPAATNIIGAPADLAKHGLGTADARFVEVKGDWNGGWAFSTGSHHLPAFASAGLWNSTHWEIFPRHLMTGLQGDTITGATSFENASLYDTGTLRTGATTVILSKAGHEVLLTTLPLAEAAPRSALARGAISDILNWLKSQ